MPETGQTTTQYDPGFTALIQQYLPQLLAQFQGTIGGGGGGADTGDLRGVGSAFMQYVQQLMGGPTPTQQAGLETLKGAQDLSNIQNAYKSYFGTIAAPTIVNNAIAGGISPGAAAEAQAIGGASAGVDLTKLQNAAQTTYGKAQMDVGNTLIDSILRGMSGAGGVYSNAGQIENQARGQDLSALASMIGNFLGYRPQQVGSTTSAPFWPTNLGGTLGAIQAGAGLIQPTGNVLQSLGWGTPGSGITAASPPIDMGAGGGFGGAWEWPTG